jgi:hypothetical protein
MRSTALTASGTLCALQVKHEACHLPFNCPSSAETILVSMSFLHRRHEGRYIFFCRRCKKLIETRMVSADDGQLKGKWHASCFTCTKCDQPFEDKDFYVHAGKPWCQHHYAEET